MRNRVVSVELKSAILVIGIEVYGIESTRVQEKTRRVEIGSSSVTDPECIGKVCVNLFDNFADFGSKILVPTGRFKEKLVKSCLVFGPGPEIIVVFHGLLHMGLTNVAICKRRAIHDNRIFRGGFFNHYKPNGERFRPLSFVFHIETNQCCRGLLHSNVSVREEGCLLFLNAPTVTSLSLFLLLWEKKNVGGNISIVSVDDPPPLPILFTGI